MTKKLFKSIVLFIFCHTFLAMASYAQLEAGVKGGVSTYDLANENLIIFDDTTAIYSLDINDAKLGFQGGLYGRLTVWKLFFQLEALINSNSVSYTFEDLSTVDTKEILNEQFTNLTAPAVIALKLKWFNLQAGVTGYYNMSTYSELINIDSDNFTKIKKEFTYGYIGGFGIDIKRFRFDARYELNTSFFGDHLEYKGETFAFTDKRNRIMANIGYRF